MKMKRTAFFCAIILSYTAFTQTTIIKNIGDYSILKVYNGIDVELIKSKEQKIEILGEKSEMVKIKSVNNTLKLSLPGIVFSPLPSCISGNHSNLPSSVLLL